MGYVTLGYSTLSLYPLKYYSFSQKVLKENERGAFSVLDSHTSVKLKNWFKPLNEYRNYNSYQLCLDIKVCSLKCFLFC